MITKKSNISKIKKWLKLQANACRDAELILADENFRLDDISFSVRNAVHISGNVREVASVLGLTVYMLPFSEEYFKLQFEYEGVTFFQLKKFTEEYYG